MRRLRPSQEVSVNLPTVLQLAPARHSDVIDFRVVAAIDYVVALEPLEPIRSRQLPNLIPDCYLTFGEGRGLTGLKGHLYQPKPGDWRFKATDPGMNPADSSFRIRVCAPITIAACDRQAAGEALETATVNFGIDGTLVDGASDWSPPEHVKLSLSLIGEDEPIETPARLVAREAMLWNFKYEAMNADARERLGSFIIDYHRDLMKLRNARYQAEAVGL